MKLSVRNIHKTYGKVQALAGVSLKLESGVYGLLGPNGAGKSTLIQIMTGNMQASKGDVFLDGTSISENLKGYKRILGYVPQSQELYPMFTAKRFLEYMALLKEVNKRQIEKQVEHILDVVGLTDVKDKKIGGFSGGMRQRLLIGQALLGNPRIIILDEPTVGLDPKERIKIRNFISKIAEDKIVLIATHVVSDVETIAKEIILLGKGKIVSKGTPNELCNALKGRVWECAVTPQKYEELEKTCIITNLQEMSDGRLNLRLIAEEEQIRNLLGDEVEIHPALPNIQEVYLNIFAESGR